MTIDELIATELRRHLPEVDEPMAWDRIRSAAAAPRRRVIRLVPVAAAALGVAAIGLVLLSTLSSGSAPVAGGPALGTWSSTDESGGAATMTMDAAEAGGVEMSVTVDAAQACSGGAATMTGTGRIEGGDRIVIPSPQFTCEDGSEPALAGGLPLEEQLRNLTFTLDPVSDTLSDSTGVVWRRAGADDPRPDPTAFGPMWPQSSLDEVRAAQALADAGDAGASWQLAPGLEERVMFDGFEVPEIATRFLWGELGWEDFALFPGLSFGLSEFGGETIEFTFVRCAPGEGNAFYPGEPREGGCVPTLDDVFYEVATVRVTQPDRRGPSGVWVVTAAEFVDPIEQVTPLTESEATAILEGFLQARVDGVGAERYLGEGDGRARLLYVTSTGASYDRYEFESVEPPAWPNGRARFEIRLFAEDGTAVEQEFFLIRGIAGDWELEAASEIVESGNALPEIQDILGGQVTFSAAEPWEGSFFGPMLEIDGEPADTQLFHPDGYIQFIADPSPLGSGCEDGTPPADAAALAESILSNNDFESTTPAAVTIGGLQALQLDVTVAGDAVACEVAGRWVVSPNTFESDPGARVRVYLIDLSGGSARILSIAIFASADRFESVLAAAAPIVDSVEFHAG